MVRRRRLVNFSIKKRMQIRLILSIMLVVIVSVGLASLFFYLLSNQEVGQTYRQFHINIKNFLELLLPGVIIAFVLGLASAASIALFFPHRIAGPLYRIEKELREEVGEGDLTVSFAVRKNDELGDLADTLNVTVERLREKVDRIKGAAEELIAVAKELDDGGRLDGAVKKMEEACKEFKT